MPKIPTLRQQIASQIEDIIWANIFVHDDSGLHLGDAIDQIMLLIGKYLPAEEKPSA